MPCGAGLLLGAVLVACGGNARRGPAPEATIGASQRAELAFRPLMRRWILGRPSERQRLDREFAAFVLEFPEDPLVRLAQVLRAFNALDREDEDRAEALIRGEGGGTANAPLFGPPGTARDLATLVLGIVERERGDHTAALDRLAPLHHRLIDPFATARLNENLVLSALGAQRYEEALRFIDGWRSEATADQDPEVQVAVRKLIQEVPKEFLRQDLEDRAQRGVIASGVVMAQIVAQQLAAYAVRDRDSELARWLVREHGELLEGEGEAVARLAVDVTRGRVVANTVGLLVALQSPAHRRRAADVGAGMAFGLGLPGSGARLVTREASSTAASVREALSELAGEGAAVVVVGLDPRHGPEAARYARDNGLPTIALAAVVPAVSTPFVFELGEAYERTTGRLVAALGPPARVGRIGAAASIEPDGAGAGGQVVVGPSLGQCVAPPPEAVRGLVGLALRDGSYCDEPFWGVAAGARVPLGLGLGVSASRRGAARLRAGVFPVDREEPRLAAWFARRDVPPSWWTALGYDAARLASSAVADLAASGTDPGEVRARRLEATSALGAARGALWTTEADGFGGRQRIARRITVDRGAPR
ncbi:MAG: hypothetical protein AAGN82_14995 [Myxococcota bacterium]